MVIADNISKMVDPIFSAPHASSLEYLLATYLFAFQIYLDFSGYTDIAVGTSRIFRNQITEKFQNTVFFIKYQGVLVKMAHIFIHMVQGLCVYTSWWKSL